MRKYILLITINYLFVLFLKFNFSFLDARKETKETGLQIFCYKFSSIPLLGKNSLRSNSFPHCHFITLNLFNAKYLRPLNKERQISRNHVMIIFKIKRRSCFRDRLINDTTNNYLIIFISTLLFLARPSSVPLSATGFVLPKALTVIIFLSTPF